MAEPRFSFHHVNAFERDGELILDMVAYDDATIVDSFYMDRLRAAPPSESSYGKLLRYRVGLDSGDVREEQLSDEILELPRIDYRERNGRPYRYVYAAGSHEDGDAPDFIDQLVKVDVETGEAHRWFESGSYPGEPVFVPAPQPDRAEDDGVLLSVVLDSRSAASYLLVLDAANLEELGRARVPHHIPFGFHGQYFS
jgi:beta,beta-carotene 9',10'-dioxygenase